jgi:TolB-like protein
VLPFANLSADARTNIFCDGLAEELLNALAKIDDLKVRGAHLGLLVQRQEH